MYEICCTQRTLYKMAKRIKEPPLWMRGEQLEQWQRAFGNLPETKKKKQSPTNALTDHVMSEAEITYGCVVARINTQGTYNEEKGIYIFSGATKGVEDVNVVYPLLVGDIKIGLTICVEIKYGKDTQNKHQIKRMNKIRAAGGVYLIARTKEQFDIDFKRIITRYAAHFSQYINRGPAGTSR